MALNFGSVDNVHHFERSQGVFDPSLAKRA
jgi:hypothetical protein